MDSQVPSSIELVTPPPHQKNTKKHSVVTCGVHLVRMLAERVQQLCLQCLFVLAQRRRRNHEVQRLSVVNHQLSQLLFLLRTYCTNLFAWGWQVPMWLRVCVCVSVCIPGHCKDNLETKLKGLVWYSRHPCLWIKKNRVPPNMPQGTCKLLGKSKNAIESTFMI